MTCLSTNEVVGFLHGDLDPDAREAVERHLDDCPACRYLVAELARVATPVEADLARAKQEEALATTAPQSFPAMAGDDTSDSASARPRDEPRSEPARAPSGATSAASRKVVTEPEGRYQVRSELRRGGQARILVAFDTFLGREVALKELHLDPDRARSDSSPEANASQEDAAVRRFLREARITGRLSHPNIVHVYEMGRRADGTLFYTMPLVRGRTLAEEILRVRHPAQRLPLLGHVEDLCQGIAYAHSQGVLHRDIKPENVMIGEFGETVLLDWGLAKSSRRSPDAEARGVEDNVDEALTAAGMTVGTPAYMSPEQAAGQLAEVDERSDIWGLGTVLYALLTGKPPFEGKTPGELVERVLTARYVPVHERVPNAPLELVAIVGKCLQRNRRHRYQSVKELQADLRAYRSGGRVQAYRYSPWERLRGYASRHRRRLLLVGAALLGVVATLVVMGREYRNPTRARDQLTADLEGLRQRAARVGDSRRRAAVDLARAHLARARALLHRRRWLLARLYAAASLAANPARETLDPRLQAAHSLRERALRLLVGSRQGRVQRLVGRWPALAAPHRLAVSADGRRVAYHGPSGQIWERRLDTGRTRRVAPRAPGGASALAFAPDGRTLAVGRRRSIELWDVRTGKVRGSLPAPRGPVLGLAFDSARRLAVVEAGRIAVWDLGASPTLRLELPGRPTCAAWSRGAKSLIYGTRGTGLFEVSLKLPVRPMAVAASAGLGAPLAIARSPSAPAQRAVADTSGLLWLTGDAPTAPLRTHPRITDLRFAPDGALLVTAGLDGTVRLWDAAGRPVETLVLPSGAYSAAFALGGRALLTAEAGGRIRQWRLGPAPHQNPLRDDHPCAVPWAMRSAKPARLLREAERASGWTLQSHLAHTGDQP